MAGNQYQADPRQALFIKGYFDPKSKTFGNALQSGLSAGYEREYAENIMSLMPDWLSVFIEKQNSSKMLEKAENNLDSFLALPVIDKDGRADKTVSDVSKFVASRLGKKKWSEKSPFVDDEGKSVFNPITRTKIDEYLNESQGGDTKDS